MAEGTYGRILIAAPDAERRARLRAALAGLEIDEAAGVEEALARIREQRPDLALAAALPGGALPPLAAAVPTIVVDLARESCVEAFGMGAVDVLVEPFDDAELVCRATVRLREAAERREASGRERELLAEAHMAAEAFESRERAIRDRKRAEEELKAANEAKDRFLATLSHELRTPLTPVLVLVSSLERDERVPDWLRGQLNLVRRNVELESRLIDDLLDLTRVTSGKLELRREAVDVGDVLAHALRASGPEIEARGLRLEIDLHPGALLAWADAPRLTQVFWNLLNNAVKFTPESGTISVRSRAESRGIAVEIRDTGMGIEPDVLPRIFAAFEQAGRSITRRFGGLGLGLAVSRAIARLHGGDLTAASDGAGQGAVFTLSLPAGVPEADLDETVALFVRREPGAGPDRGLRLLVVEDHPDTADAMADLLRDLGHEVTVARSVAAAREAAERSEGRLDLVISDLGLPDGSGLDLMSELSSRHGLRGIALSGYGMDEDLRRSREAGFTAHLTKPVSLQTLQEAILHAARG
ncbi:MAG: ATP-binding protein [Acidobacteriota bacterium]